MVSTYLKGDNERISKQMVLARMEARRNTGKPRKRWNGETEEDLKKMGIRNLHTGAEPGRNGRGMYW
jgi:hypothetical protein